MNAEPATEPTPAGDERLPVVPWTFLESIAVLVLGFFLANIAGQALPLIVDPVTARGIFFPLTLAVLAATAATYIRLRYPEHMRELIGGTRFRPGYILAGLGLGIVAFLFINMGFSILIQLIVGLTGGELPSVQEGLREATQDPQIGWLVVVSAVVVAPIAEELYFRGMLFQALRSRLGTWPGIGLSGFLFGAAHLVGADGLDGALYTMVVLSAFGMLLAWAMNRTGHLAVPVVMHMTFNGGAVVGIMIASG